MDFTKAGENKVLEEFATNSTCADQENAGLWVEG
jgi:hypothetical protein